MDEVSRAGSPQLPMLALALEAPESTRAILRGGARGAAIGGSAILMALRLMGGAAILPLGAGVAMMGAAWLGWRRDRLPAERRRQVAGALARLGARDFDRLWSQWLDGGACSRAPLRDAARAFAARREDGPGDGGDGYVADG